MERVAFIISSLQQACRLRFLFNSNSNMPLPTLVTPMVMNVLTRSLQHDSQSDLHCAGVLWISYSSMSAAFHLLHDKQLLLRCNSLFPGLESSK
ncbi:hypothetical protein MRB53_014955 [Persea americana]|uniref:Uncharacterized protein n=1 Tax=Persea americana TaxID=3435 RepID=A0ACC2KCB0_PERAE|nr:hypothetical protein MRB53_014955 [Persea americana]